MSNLTDLPDPEAPEVLDRSSGRFLKGHKKLTGAGRKAGQQNRLTVSMKAAFIEAFDLKGGVQGLLKWADSSPEAATKFYEICSRMIPAEITGPHGAPLALTFIERETLSDQIMQACANWPTEDVDLEALDVARND